jgi:hypothetical protein
MLAALDATTFHQGLLSRRLSATIVNIVIKAATVMRLHVE